MALTWDVSKIKDHEVITTSPFDENKWSPITEAILWSSLACGVSTITEKNCDEVAARFAVYQLLTGAAVNFNEGPPAWITPEDVREHIGLRTNVSEMKPAAWAKTLARWAAEDAPRALERASGGKSGRQNLVERAAALKAKEGQG